MHKQREKKAWVSGNNGMLRVRRDRIDNEGKTPCDVLIVYPSDLLQVSLTLLFSSSLTLTLTELIGSTVGPVSLTGTNTKRLTTTKRAEA